MSILDEYYATKASRNQRYDTKPILSPHETELRLEGIMMDARHILEPNRDGEFVFEFMPSTANDYHRVESKVRELLSKWDQQKGWFEGMSATEKVFGDRGCLVVSQLYAPKLPTGITRFYELHNKNVSLKLHFRDDPVGNLYLQCSYVDLYERVAPAVEEVEVDPNYDPDDDW